MRIVILTDNFREDMGGGTRIVVDLARGLRERGHRVLIVTGQFVDGAAKGFELLKLPSLRIPFYDKAEMVFPSTSLIKRVRDFDPDLLHFHEPFTAGMVALILGKVLKKKVIGSVYIDPRHLSQYGLRIDRGGLAKALVGFMGRQSDAIVFISEYQRRTYRRFLGRKAFTEVIYPGVPEVFFRSGGHRGDRRVLTVCRLAPEKNLRFAIRVMAEVQRKVEAEYILVGDGPEREKLERYARRVGARVKFLGRVRREDLPRIYAESTLFFLPSKTETFGLVFAEAMASGLPVVALNRGSAPEVVGDGGILCGEDVGEVAGAIIRLLKDGSLREDLSERALSRARRFTLDRFLEDHEDLYRKVINI
jgi:glycosyltransferase involved in cell wall biosynthesis